MPPNKAFVDAMEAAQDRQEAAAGAFADQIGKGGIEDPQEAFAFEKRFLNGLDLSPDDINWMREAIVSGVEQGMAHGVDTRSMSWGCYSLGLLTGVYYEQRRRSD